MEIIFFDVQLFEQNSCFDQINTFTKPRIKTAGDIITRDIAPSCEISLPHRGDAPIYINILLLFSEIIFYMQPAISLLFVRHNCAVALPGNAGRAC